MYDILLYIKLEDGMDLLFEAYLFSIILSVTFGILIALFIAKKFNFPKSSTLFILTIILNLVSPFIGQSAYLFGVSNGGTADVGTTFGWTVVDGPLEGIIIAYLLTSFFMTINIMYLVRNSKKCQLNLFNLYRLFY